MFKSFDISHQEHVDTLEEGKMIGEISAVFDSAPLFSVETKSYCTIAMIRYRVFKDMLIQFNDLKHSLENCILENPHDFEREYFVENVIRNIPYFQNCTGKILREIYYRGTMKQYNFNETLFNIGDKSDKLYVIMSGVVEISIKSKRVF